MKVTDLERKTRGQLISDRMRKASKVKAEKVMDEFRRLHPSIEMYG